MTERFSDIHPTWIAFGWFLSVAVAGFFLFLFIVLGLLTTDTLEGGAVWTAVAILLGFVGGGFLTGLRVAAAPVLHGIGIGLFSLLAFLVVNLVPGEALGASAWREIPISQAAGLLTLQAASAVVGARFGVRWATS
jgi:hypothetical protein